MRARNLFEIVETILIVLSIVFFVAVSRFVICAGGPK